MKRSSLLGVVLALLIVTGCSSAWSDADIARVTGHCTANAGFHADRCASWVADIHAESNCDPQQAMGVVDQIIAEYNGAPTRSVAENYELQGCRYVGRR